MFLGWVILSENHWLLPKKTFGEFPWLLSRGQRGGLFAFSWRRIYHAKVGQMYGLIPSNAHKLIASLSSIKLSIFYHRHLLYNVSSSTLLLMNSTFWDSVRDFFFIADHSLLNCLIMKSAWLEHWHYFDSYKK